MRFGIILVMLFAPAVVMAQDASLFGPQSSTPSSQGTSSDQSVQNPGQVGPASNQTSTLLQPAGSDTGSSLQTTNGVNQAPNQSNLQTTPSSDQIKVFMQGESDGSGTPDESETSSIWTYLLLGLAVIVPAALAAWVWRRQRQLGGTDVNPQPVATTPPASEVVTEKVPATPNLQKKKSKKRSKKRKK